MPGPTMKNMNRRCSIKNRRSSCVGPPTPKELPWDLLDRLFLPIVCCHAAATILSTLLNILRISQISTFSLFIGFALSTIGAVLFYHHLEVSASGKGVLVTGCESPLPWLLARKLDEMGFTVFSGFSKVKDNDDADLLKDQSSGRMKILQLDVTSEAQILEASLYISEHLPEGASGLWAIVHGAWWVALGEIEWIPFSGFRKSIDISLLGSTRLTQVMLPLVRQAGGRIVFLSSALGKITVPVRGVQCATQAGLEALALCMRQELRPRGVDVSIVAAGEFASGTAWLSDEIMVEQAKNMWAQLSEEQKRSYGEDYFESAIRSIEKYTRVEADLGPAVRSLVDSVIKTFPMPRYTPVTRSEKIQTLICEYLPRSFYDAIYRQ